jgi:hypothetical protein
LGFVPWYSRSRASHSRVRLLVPLSLSLFAYASNHLSVTLLPVWRPLPPCIKPHFSFLFCSHVLTPAHPLFLYYTTVWSFSYPVCHHNFPCHCNQSPVHLSPHLLSASVLPPFPPFALTHTFVLPFYLLLVRCSSALHKLCMYDVCLTTGNLLFWLDPFSGCHSKFELRTSFGLDKPLRTAVFGPINACSRVLKFDSLL